MVPTAVGGMYSISARSTSFTAVSLTGEILIPMDDFLELRLCVGFVKGGDQASAPWALLKGLIVEGGA